MVVWYWGRWKKNRSRRRWKKKKPQHTTTSSLEKAREPQNSNKVSAFPPPPQTTPFLNPVQPSHLPLPSSPNSSKPLPHPPLPTHPSPTKKPSSNPFKTNSRKNPSPNLGFRRKQITVILLPGTAIEEKDEAGVGVGAEIGIGKEVEIGIQGGEVGVERDTMVIEIVIEAEAIRMVIGVEIGGEQKEKEWEGGVEVFLHVNNVGLRWEQMMLGKEGKWVECWRGRMLGLIMGSWLKVMIIWWLKAS